MTARKPAPQQPAKFNRVSRPAPVSPRADDLPATDGGAYVLCHGCQKPRPRGSWCRTCEWRALEGVS